MFGLFGIQKQVAPTPQTGLSKEPSATGDKVTELRGTSASALNEAVQENLGSSSKNVGSSKKIQFEENDKLYRPKIFDAWAMGMTTVLGGTYYGWNAGFEAGFGSYAIAQVLIGLSFIVLIFALAEIVSSTSFSGGAYGMARVMLGFYPGFLMASFELTEYLTYTGASYQYVASFLCEKLEWSNNFQPLVAFVCYMLSACFLLEGDKWYWSFSGLLGVYCVFGILFFCFGSLAYTNFAENASLGESGVESSSSNWFHGGMGMFLQVLPLTTWGFGGIESGALVTDLIYQPRKNLSRGLAAGVVSLFVLMVFTMFVAGSLSPGLSSVRSEDDASSLVHNEIFMYFGFSRMGLGGDFADWIMFPAQIGMAFGFMLPAGKLFHAMSCSKLVPSVLGGESQNMCFAYTIPLSFGMCLIAMYYPAFDITNIPIFFASITYLSDLYAYYQMQTDFASMERMFKSPFGTVSVLLAGLMFGLVIVSLLGFQDSLFILYFSVGYVTLLSLYYFLYAKSRQIFSEEEQKTLLTLHVLKMNRKRRSAIGKRSKATSHTRHTGTSATSKLKAVNADSHHSHVSGNQSVE